MNSKYIGMIFDGWQVCGKFLKNAYNKVYNNPKQKTHNAYSYILVNTKNNNQTLTLSGNTLRLMLKGNRTMSNLLSATKCSKNRQLDALLRSNN